MNDMSPSVSRQVYFTAREIAELVADRGLDCFPATKRGVATRIAQERWNDLPESLSRPRSGRDGGGGMEYHLSLLPDRLQAALAARDLGAHLVVAHSVQAEADRRRAKALAMQGLGAHARQVMEARAEVLTSIEGFGIAQGQTRAWAIGQFLQAQDAASDRQEIEARRARGQILTEREVASLARPLVLEAAGGFALKAKTILAANDRKTGKASVSRRTIYNWFKARDEDGVAALAPAPTKTVEEVPPSFGDFLKFYARPSKPSVSDAHAEFLKEHAASGRNEPPMTLDQVRYVLRERMNNIEKNVGREGLLTLRSRLAYVTRTTEGMWPTTVYTADGKTFDAEIADPQTNLPIRPEITTILDIVTRKVTGISLARSENQRAVAEALRNACVACGIPAIFYTDRGPGYRNDAMDADVSGLMGRLGITKSHAAPYGSQAKGRIERPNATIWDTLAKRLPTYMGADMDKEAGQKIHKLTRAEIKEFGQSRHLPTWSEFVRLCEDMIAEYNAKPHRGLPKFQDPKTGKVRHMSPNEAWDAHVKAGFEPVMVDQEEADDLFRPYEIRTASRGEVQWNNNKFFHQALEAYHKEKVMVGYDYHQATKVWVREFDLESGQPGRLICVAEFGGNSERYFPVSFEQKAVEDRAKGRLRRNDAKREAIEAERDAMLALEHMPAAPLPDFAVSAAKIIREVPAVAPVQALPRRRSFASDEELALWALAHPGEASLNQIAVLADCLNRPAAREVFRLAGIDMEALRGLVRAAKDQTTQSETTGLRRA